MGPGHRRIETKAANLRSREGKMDARGSESRDYLPISWKLSCREKWQDNSKSEGDISTGDLGGQ